MTHYEDVGFSGTKKGMSLRQILGLHDFFNSIKFAYLHHGDCIGADAQAHEILKCNSNPHGVIIHPPIDPTRRAFKPARTILEPKPFLDRNRDIVDLCQIMVFAPETDEEQLRSGTWATYRYAKKKGIPIIQLKR